MSSSLRSFFRFQQNWSYYGNREGAVGGTHMESGFVASDETFDVRVIGLSGVYISGCLMETQHRVCSLKIRLVAFNALGLLFVVWRCGTRCSGDWQTRRLIAMQVVCTSAMAPSCFGRDKPLCFVWHPTCRNSSDKTDTLTQNIIVRTRRTRSHRTSRVVVVWLLASEWTQNAKDVLDTMLF